MFIICIILVLQYLTSRYHVFVNGLIPEQNFNTIAVSSKFASIDLHNVENGTIPLNSIDPSIPEENVGENKPLLDKQNENNVDTENPTKRAAIEEAVEETSDAGKDDDLEELPDWASLDADSIDTAVTEKPSPKVSHLESNVVVCDVAEVTNTHVQQQSPSPSQNKVDDDIWQDDSDNENDENKIHSKTQSLRATNDNWSVVEARRPVQKEPRRTTSKRKAVNYYDIVNVKGRKRNHAVGKESRRRR